MYQPQNVSRSEHVPVRNIAYHVRQWGEPSDARPPLLLLHGWMDVGASWQFVVDAFAESRWVIAPDWRGFGLTPGGGVDTYWMPDYLADLEWLLDRYAGDRTVDIVGHSMGGNIVMHYAGVRPERIRRVVNLEGFGMPARQPEEAPTRYARWIDEVKGLHRGQKALAGYPSPDGVARRLMKTNPRLPRDKADWLARHWAAPHAAADGGDGELWEILGDPAHKVINANIFRVDETLALYASITAPVLMVVAGPDALSRLWKSGYTYDEFKQRLACVPDVATAMVDDAGHMLHHDQPARVAGLIESFLG